jgi:hypothetical protein
MTYGSPYENIWVDYSPHTEGWGDVSVVESYGYTEYIRKDISDARVKELELQAVGFRESLRKAALDSEHGHEILDLCWNSYFPEMPKETNK